jgi:Holliday junction resolvase
MGNRFEAELCDALARHGFWAHNMAQNQTGQPADVIAVRNGVAHLIDCKVCSHDRFALSRIEANQEAAMTLWECKGNTSGYFALRLTDGTIWMFSLGELLGAQICGVKQLTAERIRRGMSLAEWIGECP